MSKQLSSSKKITVYDMAVVGLIAAMVFVCTMFLGIRIPTPTGTTMLKTANAVCLLGGLLFGGWRGGMAAGLGSAFFDLTYPEYAAEAPITFVRFFLMACICGLVAWWGNRAPTIPRAIVAVLLAGAFDFCFNIGKNVLILVAAGSEWIPAVVANTPKMITAVINTSFAVVVSVVLYRLVYAALLRAGVLKHLTR